MNIIYILINIILVIFYLIEGFPFLLLLILFFWISLLFFSLRKICVRSALFSFLICFFLFLLGREILQKLFYYRIEYFSEVVETHFYVSILISLVSLGFGYHIFSKKYKSIPIPMKNIIKPKLDLKIITIFYYIIWLFSCISRVFMIQYVMKFGYPGYYLGYDKFLRERMLLYLITKIEFLLPAVFLTYLFMIPEKKKLGPIFLSYFGYLLLTVLGGQRSHLLLAIFVIFMYYTKRQLLDPEAKWITKKKIRTLLIFSPCLLVVLGAYGVWRNGASVKGMDIFDLIMDFIYGQGITGNIIKWGYQLQDQISNGNLYALRFLRLGGIGRILGMYPSYANPIEFALYAGNYGDTISYLVLGDLYLKGHGLGSTYIAELYQDFGYIGIIIGNIIFSYILVEVDNVWKSKSNLRMIVKFLMISAVIWAIRASFVDFLGIMLSLPHIFWLVILYVLFSWKKKKL